jgi:hypothetical protein
MKTSEHAVLGVLKEHNHAAETVHERLMVVKNAVAQRSISTSETSRTI